MPSSNINRYKPTLSSLKKSGMPFLVPPPPGIQSSPGFHASKCDLTARCLICDQNGHSSDRCPRFPKQKITLQSVSPQRARIPTPFPDPSQLPHPSILPSRRSSKSSRDREFPSLPAISINNCLLNSPLTTNRNDVPEPRWGRVSVTPAALLPPPPDHIEMSPATTHPPSFQLEYQSRTPQCQAGYRQQGVQDSSYFEDALWDDQSKYAHTWGASPMWGKL